MSIRKQIVAVHELAHCVMSMYVGFPVIQVRVWGSGDNLRGICKNTFPAGGCYPYFDALVSLAGPYMEFRAVGMRGLFCEKALLHLLTRKSPERMSDMQRVKRFIRSSKEPDLLLQMAYELDTFFSQKKALAIFDQYAPVLASQEELSEEHLEDIKKTVLTLRSPTRHWTIKQIRKDHEHGPR